MMLSESELAALRETVTNARNWLATRERYSKAGWDATDVSEGIIRRLALIRLKTLDRTPAQLTPTPLYGEDEG